MIVVGVNEGSSGMLWKNDRIVPSPRVPLTASSRGFRDRWTWQKKERFVDRKKNLWNWTVLESTQRLMFQMIVSGRYHFHKGKACNPTGKKSLYRVVQQGNVLSTKREAKRDDCRSRVSAKCIEQESINSFGKQQNRNQEQTQIQRNSTNSKA